MGLITRRRRATSAAAGLAAVGLAMVAVTGCGSSDNGSTSSASAGASTSSGTSGVAAAQKVTDALIAGQHFGTPPTGSNPAATGKTVWIVIAGAASPTASAVGDGVEAGAKAIGWKTRTCDGKLDPSGMARCFDQAIAAKADGIIGVATDCSILKPQLTKARAAKVVTVPSFAFDCNEVGAGPSLFSAEPSFGTRFRNAAAFIQSTGKDAAAWLVASTKGKADVLDFTNQEYDTLKLYQKGFADGMGQYCPTCKVTDVNYLATEFGNKLQARAAAALTKDPSANAVQSTWNPQLGITQAIVAAGRQGKIQNIGGLGLGIDADVVRNQKGLTATLAEPLGWIGYAAVDTMNSVFNGSKPRDSGVGDTVFETAHNLPPKGSNYEPSTVDYKASYLKSWGK